MTGRPILSLVAVLPTRERLALIRRDALSDFAGATGSALHELLQQEVNASTWQIYKDRHARAVAKYRAATAAERAEHLADLRYLPSCRRA